MRNKLAKVFLIVFQHIPKRPLTLSIRNVKIKFLKLGQNYDIINLSSKGGGRMFQVGDRIVYPLHGAGVIEAIEEKEILGENKIYYILNIPHKNVQIMIPKDKAGESGMRRIVDPETLESVLEDFYEGDTDPTIYENQRYCVSLNKSKIKSGDIHQGTEIIRDLMRKSKRAKLGVEDRNMLDNARKILISELVEVKGIEQQEAVELLDEVIESEQSVSSL